jgi:hypothetical protein
MPRQRLKENEEFTNPLLCFHAGKAFVTEEQQYISGSNP